MLSSMRKLSEMERWATEKAIKINEAENAIETLWAHKTLGSDGINADFYKHLKSILTPLLLHIVKHAYEQTGFLYIFRARIPY